MDPISPISQIGKLIQKAIGKNRQAHRSSASKKAKSVEKSMVPEARSRIALKRNIVTALRKLAHKDRTQEKGIRVLVASILSWSFDEQYLQDAKIHIVVEEVTKTILDQPKVKQSAQSLLKALLDEHQNNTQKQE